MRRGRCWKSWATSKSRCQTNSERCAPHAEWAAPASERKIGAPGVTAAPAGRQLPVEQRTVYLEPGHALWPPELDNIPNPPAELWGRGRLELLATRPRVALVGSRSPTRYGEEQARRFAGALAARGVTVVSGLARGVDSAAHRAALDVEGRTIAVLGSAVDRPWPATELVDRVAADGLVLSEYSPGTPPARHHFPLRNRLIAGLSDVVVVVEAAYRSGSLITARWGADQGREVLAIPGRVDQPLARGCHRLLREGAGLVEEPGEVLDLLGLDSPVDGGDPVEGAPTADAEAGLLGVLSSGAATAGELAAHLGRALPPILAELARLELEGRVARGPGGIYRRVERSSTPRGR